MELELLPINQFQTFLICLARVAAFMSAIPVLFSGQTPIMIRTGLAVLIALIIFPVMAPFIPEMTFNPPSFFLLIFAEVLLGLLVGLIARLIFTAVEYGGTIIGYKMGFAAANIFDPQNQQQISLISQFQNIFAILIFLALDIHHLFLYAAVNSYEYLPPGHFNVTGEAVPYLLELISKMFVLGVQFSAPVLAVLILSSLVLGILARVFPQLNVFLISFPINIGIAFTVIGLTLSLVFILLRREFDELGERIITMLHYLN